MIPEDQFSEGIDVLRYDDLGTYEYFFAGFCGGSLRRCDAIAMGTN